MDALLSPPSTESRPTAPAPRVQARLGPIGPDRELVVLAGAGRSLLVVDRHAPDGTDARLVAHIAPDESPVNARIVARLYRADPRRPACRALVAADFTRPVDVTPPSSASELPSGGAVLVDAQGFRFHLAAIPSSGHRAPELRWLRHPPAGHHGPAECVSARRVVGALEDYEPVRTLTTAAVDRHRRDPAVSVATLNLELRRLQASPIVLNRRLREAVLEASAGRGVSLSAIALACGRAKLDRRGRHSGETSWLARRVGLASDDGSRRPNPWVHTDVLALIARNGLGLAPHEVELG